MTILLLIAFFILFAIIAFKVWFILCIYIFFDCIRNSFKVVKDIDKMNNIL